MMTASLKNRRLRVVIRGAVQGVGFRPFVYRLAAELKLAGWVSNTSAGVFIEVEGDHERQREFLLRLELERPPRAFIQSLESSWLAPAGFSGFEIRESDSAGEKSVLVMADIATCTDCLREIFNPADRRHLYPFTNCTNCGPRFSIIQSLPYDRPNTTMRLFAMCPACRAEYDNPLDRRFHAQPNACPVCGPHLELWPNPIDPQLGIRNPELWDMPPIDTAAEALRRGLIAAVKGLGGFHLMTDARNDGAVRRLRERKQREEKPFAVMFPGMDAVRGQCDVSEMEARLLASPESPIVLLKRVRDRRSRAQRDSLSSSLAPGNPYLGVMLPYTPLHHILMRMLGFPVVATSGNLSDEAICTDEQEAFERLSGIADVFLVHNRPIARHVDDSVARVILGRELVMRRARGYAPLPLPMQFLGGTGEVGGINDPARNVLAVGGHLKNTISAAIGGNIFISQHIGDLDTAQSYEAFRRVIDSFRILYEFTPAVAACDAHPDYMSTQYARALDLPVISVQHHYAHVAACMAENEIDGPVLGVSWDGTGYGLDGTIWGGEFIIVPSHSEFNIHNPEFRRFASLRPFPLPGGDKAVREPRRAALGVLYAIFGDELFDAPRRTRLAPLDAFSADELSALRRALERRMNAPLTSSAGRLFDAIASLASLRQYSNFEGQAAMELEFLTSNATGTAEHYPFEIREPDRIVAERHTLHLTDRAHRFAPEFIVDWQPLIRTILDELDNGVSFVELSVKFHVSLVEMLLSVAEKSGQKRIVLTGGCFQNRFLTEQAVLRLDAAGFEPYWHQRIPPNDGCISAGQAAVVLWNSRFRRR
ncbi:MAG: carbamoyltransferase HypF [bacterium]